jgi:hypothetical protein
LSGLADTKPIDSNDSATGRGRHRRIEIITDGPGQTPTCGQAPSVPTRVLAGRRAYESDIPQAGCFNPDMAGFGAGFITHSVITHSWEYFALNR